MMDDDKINELAELLMNEWYSAEDWGEDQFTNVMCEECGESDSALKKKVFEASCYFAAQQLILNDWFLNEMKRIKGVNNNA